MREEKFNEGWKYWVEKNPFDFSWDIPGDAVDVVLPHDAMIGNTAKADSPNGSNTGYRNGNNYVYSKVFLAPVDWKERTVMLKFEGVYMNAFVYLNGQLIRQVSYGYTAFYVRLEDYLVYGRTNEIRVIARNGAMPNSRWYSGGGIYRDCL